LLGLAQYARISNDPWLKEFVRNGYEYIRNLGIARLGVFGETCVIAEMTLEFPVVETTETYTLKWQQTDRWFESNWPADSWQPGSDRYVCRFRGNTLVEIRPIPNRVSEGLGYPLYQRAGWRTQQAPMKPVTRFVPGTR